MKKNIMFGIVFVLFATLVLGAQTYNIITPTGTISINSSIITGTNIDCSDVVNSASDLCTITSGGGGGNGTYDLNVSGNTGSGTILDSEIFSILGSGTVSTVVSGNTITLTGTAHTVDSNETTRVDNLGSQNCGSGNFVRSFNNDLTVNCFADQTSAGGGGFTDLNITNGTVNESITDLEFLGILAGTGINIGLTGNDFTITNTVTDTNLNGTSANGDLTGTYPDPTLNTNSVNDNEIDYSTVTLNDFTNDAGYLTSFTETDPVFSAHVTFNLVQANFTNWNTAFSWGNHATAGYLTSEVDGSTTNELQDLWDVFNADSGSTTANTNTDTLTVSGSGTVSTSISADTLTITGTAHTIDTDTTLDSSLIVNTTGDTMTGNLNLSNNNVTNIDCLIFQSGGKICTG